MGLPQKNLLVGGVANHVDATSIAIYKEYCGCANQIAKTTTTAIAVISLLHILRIYYNH